MKSGKRCILLTGSIKPKEVFSLKRADPFVRENDYYQAIVKWLQFNIPVVFCENSNYNSEKIKNISDQNFEFLQYEESEDLSEKGKGYGEYLIMKYAHDNSQQLKKSEYVIKVTGRLFIKNFQKIFSIAAKEDFDIMAPMENNLRWSDSRLVIYQKDFFVNYFSHFAMQINDSSGVPFERALAFAIHAMMSDNMKWEMLPFYPKYSGYSGTHNIRYTPKYKLSFLKQISFPLLRYLIRK